MIYKNAAFLAEEKTNKIMRKLLAGICLSVMCLTTQAQEVKPKTPTKKASYYGKKLHGRKTASGAKFDMNGLTAAHKTLPFGTKVKVTNVKNNKSVVVTITDRGPLSKARSLDLSKGAFMRIEDLRRGIVYIKMEILK